MATGLPVVALPTFPAGCTSDQEPSYEGLARMIPTMTVSPRCRPGHDQLRPVERRRRQDDSPEAVLLSLAAEIRSLSAERPFSEELLLMEQVFVLLLDGFRRQALPDGRVGLLPPQAAVAAPAGDQPLAIPAPAYLG